MTDFKKIYQSQAEDYDYLVSHEDYEGNILKMLRAIRPLANNRVIELGGGTGRLTRLLLPYVAHITTCDISPAMLAVARQKLSEDSRGNWQLLICDNRAVAVAGKSADLIITGWSLGHFTGWYPDSWPQEIGQSLAEMRRILRPGGTIIILETQGTNRELPHPPAASLADYYQWLEQVHSFQFTWIRTDYHYPTVADAVSSIRFFFGDSMAEDVQSQNSPIVPECTGIWWWHG